MGAQRDLIEEAKWCLDADDSERQIRRLRRKGWKSFGSTNSSFKKVFAKGNLVAKVGNCEPDLITYRLMRRRGLSRFLATAYHIDLTGMVQRKVEHYEDAPDELWSKLSKTLDWLREELESQGLLIWDTGERNLGHLNGKLKILDCFVYYEGKTAPWW